MMVGEEEGLREEINEGGTARVANSRPFFRAGVFCFASLLSPALRATPPRLLSFRQETGRGRGRR